MKIWRAEWSRILPAFSCAAVLLLIGCRTPRVKTSAAVAIEYEISPQPVRVGPLVIAVKLHDAAGQSVSGAGISLEADMSHPGMAPVVGDAKEIAPGRYQGMLEFAMPGDWVVLIHVTLPDGRTLERDVNVPGVAAN